MTQAHAATRIANLGPALGAARGLSHVGLRLAAWWRGGATRQVVVATVLSLGAVFVLGHAWLSVGVPAGDLPGAAAELARWHRLLARGDLLAPWDGATFFGHPRSMMNLYSGMALAYAPFALVFEPLMAVKVGSLAYLGLSGASAFVLMRHVLRHGGLALVLGIGYALHPVHLGVSVASSHANFPPFYALAPLVVWLTLRLLRRPGSRAVAALATVLAAAAWIDLERVAVLLPGLTILAAGLWLGRLISAGPHDRLDWRKQVKPALAWGLSLIAAAGLLGFLLVPAMAEQSAHAMFSAASRQSSLAFFSLKNPFYYVDRGGRWLGALYTHLPAARAHDAGTFYLGWTLMLLAGAGLVRPPKARRQRWLLVSALVAGGFSLAAAQGNTSGYRALTAILDRVLLYDRARRAAAVPLEAVTLILLALIGGVIGLSLWRCRSHRGYPGFLLGGLGLPLTLVLFTKPLPWFLDHLPLYDQMRNPGWFATAVPTLALMIAGGLGARALLQSTSGHRAVRLAIVLAIAGGIAWDVWPYHVGFDRQAPVAVQRELAVVGHYLQTQGKPGRVMIRESYNPRTDLLALYTDRGFAFSWLNWMATRGASDLMLGSVYPNLHRPKTREGALRAAGAGHVRYVLYDLDRAPPPPGASPPESSEGKTRLQALTQRWRGEHFALYENQYCRPYARLAPIASATDPSGQDEEPGPRSQVTPIATPDPATLAFEVTTTGPSQLIVAESWAPGWTATVDGHPAKVTKTRGAFLRVPVPSEAELPGSGLPGAGVGEHRVGLHYHRSWGYAAGLGTTLATLLALAGVSIRPGVLRGRRRRLAHPQSHDERNEV